MMWLVLVVRLVLLLFGLLYLVLLFSATVVAAVVVAAVVVAAVVVVKVLSLVVLLLLGCLLRLLLCFYVYGLKVEVAVVVGLVEDLGCPRSIFSFEQQ